MIKMNAVFLFLTLFFFALLPVEGASETIRSKAETHFSLVGWSNDPAFMPPVDRKFAAIPGGDETFPAMTPTGDAGLVSVYPEIEGLGALDYSELDPALLDLFVKAADNFRNRELSPNLCDHDRAFLSPVNTYRLKKLPEIQSVLFSRPTVEDPVASGIFRFMCAGGAGADSKSVPLFVTVTASHQGNSWVISDITFDGKIYAQLAEQN